MKNKIIIWIIIMFAMALVVNAEQICFPNEVHCGNIIEQVRTECELDLTWTSEPNFYGAMPSYFNFLDCWSDNDYVYGCEKHESIFLCADAFWRPDVFNPNWGYYYCNIDDVVECPNGCNVEANTCYGDEPECSEGYMRCGTSEVYDPDGVLQKCINGVWATREECEHGCVEEAYNYAYCDFKKWYCLQNNFQCYFKSSGGENCYETEEDCLNNRVYYCADESGKCRRRLGSCYANERSFTGTDLDDVYRSCVQSGWQCQSNPDCPPGFECNLNTHKCENTGGNPDEPTLWDYVLKFFKDLAESVGFYLFIFGILGLFAVAGRYFFPMLKTAQYWLIVAGVILVLLFLWYYVIAKLLWFI